MDAKNDSQKTKIVYRGSMPAPQKEHGEEMLGGVILGRDWVFNTWVYRVLLPNGNMLYNHAP